MATLSLRLPQSLHGSSLRLQSGRVWINQLINSAVGEKLAALMTEAYLEERGKRASRKRFKAALAKLAAIEPEDVDRLPGRRPAR